MNIKRLFVLAATTLLGASLAFGQTGSTAASGDAGKSDTTKTKKHHHHKGGKKSKKSSGGTTTQPPK